MAALKKIFAGFELAKTEELDDGTIKVWGFASTTGQDSDGETITADAMKSALPGYMKWGAVREMHAAKAAGTAIEAEVQDDGKTWFGAHIVDTEAVKKVKTGVYKGFSVGGKVTARDELNKATITGINLVEVSLVDRPCNPETVLTMYKAEGVDLNEPLQKGMYSLQDFACILASLGWLAGSAQNESEWEGDNSPVPKQLRDWLAQGIEIFRAMAVEETAELLAELKTAAGDVDALALMHAGGNLAKAGAKFSAATKEALAKAHQAVKDAADHIASTGYDANNDEPDEGAAKVAGLSDDLKKVSGDLAAAQGDLKKVADERDTLAKRVKELEAMPAPGKAVLKAVAHDPGQDNDALLKRYQGIPPVTDDRGNVNDVATLIKFAHKSTTAA